MPGLDGFDTAKYLKSNPKTEHIPIIFLTAAYKKEEFQLKGFEVGAIDYLTKPIEDMQFINKLRLYKEVIFKTKALEQTLAELEKKNKLLEELYVTDNLTKIYNRNKLDQVLTSEVNRSNRYGTIFGIILIDIDYFKSVNDIHGHLMGDIVLKEFAGILSKNSRVTDTIGRWGGEEFMIICTETNLEGLYIFATSLKDKISSFPFSIKEKKTASFGISVYNQNENIDELIRRVDEALYTAKKNGRDKVESL